MSFRTDEQAYSIYTPSYHVILRVFESNFELALYRFKDVLECDESFQVFSCKLHKIPLYMLDTLIEKVSDLSDEGKKRLEKIKILVEEFRQKQIGG